MKEKFGKNQARTLEHICSEMEDNNALFHEEKGTMTNILERMPKLHLPNRKQKQDFLKIKINHGSYAEPSNTLCSDSPSKAEMQQLDTAAYALRK